MFFNIDQDCKQNLLWFEPYTIYLVLYKYKPFYRYDKQTYDRSVTLILGLVSGLAFPSLYNLFAIWSGPEERATLMSIVFSGISFANMINLPFSAGLCATGIDGGWPMVFYVPGGLGLLWCLIFKFLCFSTPQNHPWISDFEKIYLVTSCKVNFL